MASLYFDGDLRRIYEVPEASSFLVDGSGYRIYTPDVLNTASTSVSLTASDLWSRYVDFHSTNQWIYLAFSKTGGAFRELNSLGDSIYATFDIRLINDWQIVPADYPHNYTIVGNLFENVPAGTDFDISRLVSTGVSPRIKFSDSLQVIRETGGTGDISFTEIDRNNLILTRDHARATDAQTQLP